MSIETTCPACDQDGVITELKTETFTYGVEPDSVEITAMEIPTMTCPTCGFTYTDHRAEDIRDAAVRNLRSAIIQFSCHPYEVLLPQRRPNSWRGLFIECVHCRKPKTWIGSDQATFWICIPCHTNFVIELRDDNHFE